MTPSRSSFPSIQRQFYSCLASETFAFCRGGSRLEAYERAIAKTTDDDPLASIAKEMVDSPTATVSAAGSRLLEGSANFRLNAIAARSPKDADLQRDLDGAEMNLDDGLTKIANPAEALPHAVRAGQKTKQLAGAHVDDPDPADAARSGLEVTKRAGLPPWSKWLYGPPLTVVIQGTGPSPKPDIQRRMRSKGFLLEHVAFDQPAKR